MNTDPVNPQTASAVGPSSGADGAPCPRLARQLDFIREIDKLKQVSRQTLLMDGTRRENSAEHSWHLALMAPILVEYVPPPRPDLLTVVEMVLLHDLVEIDAGDTYCYDEAGRQDQQARERTAADRIFDLLPADQATRFRRIWDEFESGATPEAHFARALDRLQPLLHNIATQGRSWREHGIDRTRVVARNRSIADGAPALWDYIAGQIEAAVANGYLKP